MRKTKTIRSHYEPKIAHHRESYRIADWASPASQRARFQVLLDNVDLRSKTLLDVGCGPGDLWGLLADSGFCVDYTGVDILDDMVRLARQQHPDGRFHCADIFRKNPFKRQFDVVFCSGAFNLNLGNNGEFLPRALRRLFQFTREHLVFNLLHERSRYLDQTYSYHNPPDVRRMLQPLPCEVRVIDDYLPNDFTVICRRRSPW